MSGVVPLARTAWITGAGSGIGRALALRLAAEGTGVAATARTAGALEELAAQAAGLPGKILPFPADVTDPEAMERTVAAVEDSLGPIGLAVLNAGTHIPMGLEDFSSASARSLMEVNYMGVVHGLEALLPRMRGRRSGHLAVVSSVAGYRGLPTAAAYGPTKAALINLCESLKLDCDRVGIRLQLVNPGFVATPLTAKNPFPMPDLIGTEEAAGFILRGLRSQRFEISFPRRFAHAMKALRLLPDRLYFPLIRKVTGA